MNLRLECSPFFCYSFLVNENISSSLKFAGLSQ
jgi:hypothetical protein